MPEPALVAMSDVLRHCGLAQTDTTYLVELQTMIDAATPIVEYITGPINPLVVTSEVYPTTHGESRLILRSVPVQSVQSVIEYIGITAWTLTSQPPGATVNNYGYSLDRPEAGLLVRRSAFGQEMPFLGTVVVVSYTAGLPVINGVTQVPPDVKLAVLEDIRGLFQQTQLGGRPKFGASLADEDGWTVGPLHLFPRLAAVLEGRARTQSIA